VDTYSKEGKNNTLEGGEKTPVSISEKGCVEKALNGIRK